MSKPVDSADRLKWERGGEEAPLPRDGREARAERTKKAVADALLDLVADGDLRPTSKNIAERAGGYLLAFIAEHLDIVTGHGYGGRTDFDRQLTKANRIACDGPRGFGLPPMVDNRHIEHVLQPPNCIGIGALTGQEYGAQRRHVIVFYQRALAVFFLDSAEGSRCGEQA